jgi:hypothetical protein
LSIYNISPNDICKAQSDIIYNKIKHTKSKARLLLLRQVAFFHVRGVEMRVSQTTAGKSISKKRQCANRTLQYLWRMGAVVKRYIRVIDSDGILKWICSYKLAPIMLQDYLFNALLNPLRNAFPQANDTLIRLIICLETNYSKFRFFNVMDLSLNSQIPSKSKSWDDLVSLSY